MKSRTSVTIFELSAGSLVCVLVSSAIQAILVGLFAYDFLGLLGGTIISSGLVVLQALNLTGKVSVEIRRKLYNFLTKRFVKATFVFATMILSAAISLIFPSMVPTDFANHPITVSFTLSFFVMMGFFMAWFFFDLFEFEPPIDFSKGSPISLSSGASSLDSANW